MDHDSSVLLRALRYPWNGGAAGTTLVGGGVLTLLSPLIVPALLVAGYNLRVVEAVLAGREDPPRFDGWGGLLVDGLKAAVVLVAYVLVPLAVGTALLGLVAGLLGFRFRGGVPSLTGGLAVGGLAFVVALLLAGLALVVWYVAPAALVRLAATRRLGAAFSFEEVRSLAEADAYGSSWLLAVAVFATNAVVLLVLNAAGVGVILSGFVSFYAFVAMSFLFATGAETSGIQAASSDGDGAPEADPDVDTTEE